MIIWLTGISGSGKTTIAEGIIKKYKNYIPQLINVDGDMVREFFGDIKNYDENSRILQIKRIQKICKFLERQKLILIVSALYSNKQLLDWNRKNFSKYFEIYLEASLDLVRKRDPKNLYKKYYDGVEENVVGIDIKWNPPTKYDLKINMTEDITKENVIDKISLKINIFNNIGL